MKKKDESSGRKNPIAVLPINVHITTPGDIVHGNDPKRKNFRHRVHRDYFIKELKISRGRNPGKKLVFRISEMSKT